jgi:hypothetical protein
MSADITEREAFDAFHAFADRPLRGTGAAVKTGDRVIHAGSGRAGTVTGRTAPNPFNHSRPCLPLVLIDGTNRPQAIAEKYLAPAL